MPWRQRGGKSYCYNAKKVDGRVRTKYVGTGPEADRAAAEVRRRQDERALQLVQVLVERWRNEPAVRAIVGLNKFMGIINEAALLSVGYRLRDYHWRKPRDYRAEQSARGTESAAAQDLLATLEDIVAEGSGRRSVGPAGSLEGLHG